MMKLNFNYFLESCSCPWGKIINIVVLFFSCNAIQAQRDNSLVEMLEWNPQFDSVINSKRLFLLQHIHSSKFVLDANGFFLINFGVLIGVREHEILRLKFFHLFSSFRLLKQSLHIW